jgi:hypothetical protein
LHAFWLLLPAATTIVTPALMAFWMAVSVDGDPPLAVMLMFATAGFIWFARTQSIPSIKSETKPELLHESTLTAWIRTFFATP